MTGFGESSALNSRYVFRQDTAPRREEGVLWLDTSGGTTALRQYDSDTDTFDCLTAYGSDEPGGAVEGTLWYDTTAGATKQYTGAAFEEVGVSDHANLQNVNPAQHHARYTDDEALGVAEAYDPITAPNLIE